MGDRQLQLLPGFVVAMQHDPLGGHAALQGGEQLTGGNRIKPEALRGRQGGEHQRTVGLGGVEGQRRARVVALQCLAVGPAGGAQGVFIQHIQRGAVALGQFTEAAAAHLEAAEAIEVGGDRGEIAVGTERISLRLEGAIHQRLRRLDG